MATRKHTDKSAKQIVYYAPSREAIASFVQSICDKLTATEGSNAYTQEICSDFADFVEIVMTISVAQANHDSHESLDNTALDE